MTSVLKNNRRFIIGAVIVVALLVPFFVFAADTGQTIFLNATNELDGLQLGRGTGNGGLPNIISSIINALLGFLGVVFLGLMVYGGFIWMLARGNDDEVDKAIGTIRAAVIGLLIVLASYGISFYIFDLLEGATGATPATSLLNTVTTFLA